MEYARSSYVEDGTLGGVNFAPEIGVRVEYGTVFAGVNMLKEFGTDKVIDKATPILYFKNEHHNYDYTGTEMANTFHAGIFPRKEVLGNYSDFLFWQPRTYYMPVIQGLSYKMKYDDYYSDHRSYSLNAWVDWTGKPNENTRESFFGGLSGDYEFGRNYDKSSDDTENFFIDFQGYYFHLANENPSQASIHVCDNGQAILKGGYYFYQEKSLFFHNPWSFKISAGIMAGLERERNVDNQSFTPIGFVGQVGLKYRNFGLNNDFYFGQKRQRLYNKYGDALYFGNPFLRGKSYWKTDVFWEPFHSNTISSKLACQLHFSEGEVMFEQYFTLAVKL
jgi:hypothetical protein